MGKRNKANFVQRRFQLSSETAIRLSVLAAIERKTESEVIEWALIPHIAFDLPKTPDVAINSLLSLAGKRSA